MKIWIIKHKGKTWWGNLISLLQEMQINKNRMWVGEYYLTKKQAKNRMNSMSHSEYLEVVSAEVTKSKQDNRKV